MADRPAPGLVVHQPERGFRYGAEAFWLAGFALEGPPALRALDLGTGSGVVALLLARQGLSAVGIDVRDEWAPLWRRTLAESRVPGAIDLRWGDVAHGVGGTFDLVVSNPPFFPADSGPVAPDPWKAAARTESGAHLSHFVDAGLGALAPEGRLCLVIPVERAPEVRPPGASLTRRVGVGRRRVLLELRAGTHDLQEDLVLKEDHPRVRGWYHRLRG